VKKGGVEAERLTIVVIRVRLYKRIGPNDSRGYLASKVWIGQGCGVGVAGIDVRARRPCTHGNSSVCGLKQKELKGTREAGLHVFAPMCSCSSQGRL
jgi:hypothetical protein